MPQPKGSRSSKPSTPRKAAGAGKKPAAKTPAAASEKAAQESRDEQMRENLASLRELLSGGVVLTAQGVTEALENAVSNGRMLRRDAEDLARGLMESGRRQSQLLVRDLEQLLGIARTDLDLDLETPADAARSAAGAAKAVAEAASDRVLREADRARRVAKIPPAFPILGYEDLNAGQVVDRLGDLSPAELRKVRDFERRHKERVRVLKAIDKALDA